ncbi:MAG TPA: PIG-L family deacetylase [Thermoflexales bacterium]|nr:PIG-L family deacetylase [Thermoflexales bacterium]HQZ21824.1 PIG-L family deacetylase [Thermoflexales bacterium]
MPIFLSPHLDDIALSCGGRVKRMTAQGREVVIATLCTADAPTNRPLSAAAQRVHKEWQLGDQPYAARRAEDQRACAALGAKAIHLNLLDAIYRFDEAGQPLYTDQFIGVQPHPYDVARQLPALKAALHAFLAARPRELVYAPMAVGGHVDHTLTRAAAEAVVPAARLRYYEDYPYAGWTSARMKPAYTLDKKSAGLRPHRLRLTEDEIAARVSAIACYASQMAALFGSAAAMPPAVRQYISSVKGERYWRQ